jgi:hypothetical protein
MNDIIANQLVVFPELRRSSKKTKTDQETVDHMFSWRGIKRSGFYIPMPESRSAAHVDLVVIDERTRYNLKHIVFTIWHQNYPVGIFDQASPHLFKDAQFRMFGIGNETLPEGMSSYIADSKGIPGHELRHHPSHNTTSGYYFTQEQVRTIVTPILTNLSDRIFERLYEIKYSRHKETVPHWYEATWK